MRASSRRFSWLATFLVLCVLASFGQRPKVTEQNGHLSPVLVKLTFRNGTSRTTMLRGIGASFWNQYSTHIFTVWTDGGAAQRRIWLDSIAAINGTGKMRTTGSEFTVVLKDGKEITAQYAADIGCDKQADQYASWLPDKDPICKTLYTSNEDDGDQKIDLGQVMSVEFLGAARKDKAGNAMFETWRYSPYTGEKLPTN